ncbi:MAG: hypothetical protein VX672_03310 [Planctomycetota bacterium]|nr:hypothetical protein [Planctomycetota bacterium]
MLDDDPSDEDVDRFSGEMGFCPDCGEEIWDEAWQCPHCGEVVENRVRRERLDEAGRQVSTRTKVALVLALVGLLLLWQLL